MKIYLSDLEKIGIEFQKKEEQKIEARHVKGVLRLNGREYLAIFRKNLNGSFSLYQVMDMAGNARREVAIDFVNALNQSGLSKLGSTFRRRSKFRMMLNVVMIYALIMMLRGIWLYQENVTNVVWLIMSVVSAVIAAGAGFAKTRLWQEYA